MTSDDLPPGVERCSCDEALMLRAEVSRLRALLTTAAERDRDLCAELDDANALLQYIWDQYDNEDELSADTLERLNAHLKPVAAQEGDPLHPSGRCTCGGEGSCDWCMTHCLHCGAGYPGGVPKSQLDAANALLVRCDQHPDVQGSLKREIRAHLGGQSAPPEADLEPPPTAVERGVLEAVARADTEELVALVGGELFPGAPPWEIAACRAELARRKAPR